MLVYTITKGENKSFVYDIYHGVQGPQGEQGVQGEQGIQGIPGTAATIQVGSVTSGSTPSVTNVGTSNAAIFDFVLEKGDKGDQGPVGQAAGFGTPTASASTLTPGASATASVTATGDATQKVFDFSFGIPAGQNAGFGTPTASATSLSAGSTPTIAVTASGQDTAKVFDFAFGIPKGDKGDTGSTGPTGPGVPSGGVANQILLKSSSTDYDTQWKDVWEVKATELNSANFKLNLFKNGTEFTDAAYILYTVEKDRNAGSSFTRQRAISYDSDYGCYYIQLDNGEWLPNGFFRVTVKVYSDSTKTTLLGSDLIDYFDTATSIGSGVNGFTTGDQVYTALQNAGSDSWNIEVNYFTSNTMVLKAFKNGTAYSGTIFAYLTYGDGTTSQRTPNPMMLTASSGTITITSSEFSDIATVLADATKTNFYFEFQETFTGSIFYTVNYVRNGAGGDVWEFSSIYYFGGSALGYYRININKIRKNGEAVTGQTLYCTLDLGNNMPSVTGVQKTLEVTSGNPNAYIDLGSTYGSDNYKNIWISIYEDSARTKCIYNGTLVKAFKASKIKSGEQGYTTGDQVYDYITTRVPTPPTTDGTYSLQVSVSSGTATYSWV